MTTRTAIARHNTMAGRARLEAAMASLPAPRQAEAVLTAEQAAQRLGVSVRQLNRYQQAGRITPQQNMPRGRRRFTEAAVDALAATLKDQPAT